MKVCIKRKNIAYISIFIVLGLFSYLAYKSLTFPYLSYDESGQFFMSKGLNHHSMPYSHFGTLADALENNKHYNLDPGGFTVLLFFWAKVSNECFWLRLLPLLFFGFFLYYVFRIINMQVRNATLAALGCGVLMLSGDITYQLPFLRAYSMEMCGTMATLYYLLCWKEQLTYKKLLTLGLMVAFFCTSRYSYLFTAFVIGIIVLMLLYKQNSSLLQIFKKLATFTIPILLICIFIFWGMTIHQNAGASNIGYTTYLSTTPSALKGNLAIAFYLMLAACTYFYIKFRHVPLAFVVASGVSVIAFVLSLMNKFPWDGKKDISVTILLYVGLYLVMFKLSKTLIEKIPLKIELLATLLLLFVLCYGIRKRNHEQEFRLHDKFVAFMNTKPHGKIFVNWTLSPDLRYLYEFGAFRNRSKSDGYPGKFMFGNREWHSYSNEKGLIRVLNLEKSGCAYYYNNSSASVKGWQLMPEYGTIFKRIN